VSGFGNFIQGVPEAVRRPLLELKRLIAEQVAALAALTTTVGLKATAVRGTYTPTVVGAVTGTGGSAQNAAWYTFVGGSAVGDAGLLYIEGVWQFGTSGQTFPAATWTFSLPSGFNFDDALSTVMRVGDMTVFDADTSRGYEGKMQYASLTTARVLPVTASGTYTEITATSTTVPITWASNDVLLWRVVCRAQRV
jgi:hypothetical protein